MENSAKLIYCRKCLGFMPHEIVHDDIVECNNFGDRKQLKDPAVVEAEIATQGKPEDA